MDQGKRKAAEPLDGIGQHLFTGPLFERGREWEKMGQRWQSTEARKEWDPRQRDAFKAESSRSGDRVGGEQKRE